MDWPSGKDFADFLGFAILRTPGFSPKEQDGYLLNKVGFQPPGPNSQSLPSNISPIQKFLWWDSAISDANRGQTFKYTVTPVRGSGPNDLNLVHESAATLDVLVPKIARDGISTWFNRAVVSSQSFSNKFPDPQKALPNAMAWLSNGMENAFASILNGADEVAGAIYHLTDNHWVVPALKSFNGKLSIVYENRENDTTDKAAIDLLASNKFQGFPRSKTNIMHDKFLVDVKNGRVLAGSANFTPEGITSQANVLHVFESADMAAYYAKRQAMLQADPSVPETAKGANWSKPFSVGKSASIRVFLSPEPTKQRKSIDTVVSAIKRAKSSVAFCMFDPTDPELLTTLIAVGDQGKLLYGMLNAISTPNVKADDQTAAGEAPLKPTASTEIKVTLYNRSRKDKKILAYSYFAKGDAPAGFLPEFSTVDLSSMSTLPPAKPGGKFVPAVHIHHKFIIIDGETASPTIYTGSNNLSNNSTVHNDENLIEITGSPELAQTYFAEFIRLYEHYRARALWNMAHPPAKSKAAPASSKLAQTFTLKTKRDDWVKDAYRSGTPEFIARTTLAADI